MAVAVRTVRREIQSGDKYVSVILGGWSGIQIILIVNQHIIMLTDYSPAVLLKL
jgi:hypothetical protein